MVSLSTVRKSNAGLKELGPGLVAVFIGATSGIGETTAREFVRNTVRPTVYLVGRNETQALSIIEELQKINTEGKINFIKSDVSLLRNVDSVCETIKSKETKINLLFLSAGILTMKGRDETEEGLDKKFSVHYYSRMRFITNFLPLLNAASGTSLSRVVSVLAAGMEGKLQLDDLSLKSHYSLSACANHATTMNSLIVEELATANPKVSFVHTYPGFVKTNLARSFGSLYSVFSFAITPFAVPLGESGERHLYAATSKTFPPLEKPDAEASIGSTGVKGSGAYLLHWNGESTGKEKLLKEYRAQGVGKKIWEHTLDVFDKICGTEGGRY